MPTAPRRPTATTTRHDDRGRQPTAQRRSPNRLTGTTHTTADMSTDTTVESTDGHDHTTDATAAHDDTAEPVALAWPRPWDPAEPIDVSGVEGVTIEQEVRAARADRGHAGRAAAVRRPRRRGRRRLLVDRRCRNGERALHQGRPDRGRRAPRPVGARIARVLASSTASARSPERCSSPAPVPPTTRRSPSGPAR